MAKSYNEKLNSFIDQINFSSITKDEKKFILNQASEYWFSFADINNLIKISIDLNMWGEKSLQEIQPKYLKSKNKKEQKKELIAYITNIWENLKTTNNDYKNFKSSSNKEKITLKIEEKQDLGLGACPVASFKTRCCNLLTLDAVESCGFDCSYCSIQSFYNQNRVSIDSKLGEKLKNLKLDPKKTYHIGTGQSSDSLLWGNKGGVLDALKDFAIKNPNVILELKTKSNNIKYLLENDIPKNIICTFSISTHTIHQNEEHKTASIDERIQAARNLANKGIKVGFHFHPIVVYDTYLADYQEVIHNITKQFNANEVALISLGTLTFTKSVMKQIRERGEKTKILQMPFAQIAGKYSYPLETKIEMFKNVYDAFASYHEKVFFYLCMEDHSLWSEVFEYEYKSNEEFEQAMKKSYFDKIAQ